ncbi:retrovirus-related pol polyprotein from transposon TNT 1-94 [Tanacetum coccineum]
MIAIVKVAYWCDPIFDAIRSKYHLLKLDKEYLLVSSPCGLRQQLIEIDNKDNQTEHHELPRKRYRNTNPQRVYTIRGNSTGTYVSRPRLRSTQMKDKAVPNNIQVKFKKTEVEDRHRISSISNKTKSVTAFNDSLKSRTSNVNAVCATCGKLPISTRKPKSQANNSVASKSYYRMMYEKTSKAWKWWIEQQCPSGYKWVPKTKMKWVPKTKNENVKKRVSFAIDNASRITNLGTVRFGNDQFAPILGYGDLVQGNIMINMVYYLEGLNHNLFSVGQFCDADLEVAFRKSTCFVRDLQALPTQAWLWHQRLSHLNFDYINLLSKKDVLIGLPKLKYVKDQLCSSCEVTKAKRSSFKTKDVPSSKRRLNLLHMDLCGPMRVASINGKKYILFLNTTLHAFFKEEGIEHQTFTPRTPEQNGVVKRRNRTLVEAARTVLSASKLPLFFWVEAIATACYTQNRSIIISTHEKRAYHIINDRKPSIKHRHIFGCTYYLTRDGENLDKMKEKGDPCILALFPNDKRRQIMTTLAPIDQGVGSTSGIRACALRNFDLGIMELENSQNNALAKLPMLKIGEYKMWEIRIKQYFQIQDYALWEVIENGNSWVPIPVTAPESGPSTALKMTVPSTAEEKICKKNDVKARSLLLMALPNEHQLTFNQYVDAQSMFVAIKARFGGNEATKRTQKALLKQQYENFNASSSESLDSIFNRLQKLVSRLAILGVVTPPEDLNVKFLRSLPSEWDTHVVVWMNKPDFDTMGLDDLYNNFKIVEQKVKKSTADNNDDKNLAFLTTSSPSSTNTINTVNTGVSTGTTKVNTASTETSTASFSDATVYAFLSTQPQGSQLVHEDLEQLHDDDLEEMDLKWNMALLSMRARKFYQRTRRKIIIDGSSTAGYDKSKVECFNCHKMGHFARECRAPRSKDNKNWNQGSSSKAVRIEDASKNAMCAIDGAGFDWSDKVEDEIQANMPLMAFTDSEKTGSIHMLSESHVDDFTDIEDDIMDPVMQCTTLPSHSGFSQKKLVSFVTEIHTTSIDFRTPTIDKSPTHYPCDSARTFRVILFSIHNNEWKSFQCHHQTALRIHKDRDGDALFQLKSDSLPHAHAQTTKDIFKHQDSRIMKAQELNDKVFRTNSDIAKRTRNILDNRLATIEKFLSHVGVGIKILLNAASITDAHIRVNAAQLYDRLCTVGSHIEWCNLAKTTVVEGVEKVMPVTSTEDKAQRRLEVKARSTLMMGIPNEHQLKFNSIKDAKKLLEAVEKRFGGNAATKKTQRNLLKQQYENFTAPSLEMLDQTPSYMSFLLVSYLRKNQKEFLKLLEDPARVYRNKKDERGIVIRNKARLVAQGHTQEEGIDYDESIKWMSKVLFCMVKLNRRNMACFTSSFEDPDHPDKFISSESTIDIINHLELCFDMEVRTTEVVKFFEIVLSGNARKQPVVATSTHKLISGISQCCGRRSAEASTDDNGEVKINATIDGHSLSS